MLLGYALGRLRGGEGRPRPLPVLAIPRRESAQSVPFPSLAAALPVKTDQVLREATDQPVRHSARLDRQCRLVLQPIPLWRALMRQPMVANRGSRPWSIPLTCMSVAACADAA